MFEIPDECLHGDTQTSTIEFKHITWRATKGDGRGGLKISPICSQTLRHLEMGGQR